MASLDQQDSDQQNSGQQNTGQHKIPESEPRPLLVPRWLAWSYVALLVITLAFWGTNLRGELSLASHAYSRDFLGVYIGARSVASGHGSRVYDFEMQRQTMDVATAPYKRYSLMPFIYPAYVAVLLVPLGKLSLSAALLMWTVVNLCAALWIATLVIEFLPNSPVERLASGAAFCAWIPLQLTLVQGQLGLLAALAITGAWTALRKGNQVHAACWLALGLFKPQLIAFPLLALLIWRYWRAVFVFATAFVAILGVSFARLGFWIPTYVKFVGDYNRLGAKVALYPIAMQNWRGLVFAVLKTDTSLASRLTLAGLTLGSLIVAVMVYAAARLPEQRVTDSRFSRWDLAFAIGVLLGTLSSPHLYLHDWVVALPAMTILLCVAKESFLRANARRQWPIMLIAWLVRLSPFVLFAVQFGIWRAPGYIQLLPWYIASMTAIAIRMFYGSQSTIHQPL